MIISPAQTRAARALLDQSQQQLCDAAGVGRATLANFESGKSTPYERTLRDIRTALENAGISFLESGSVAPGPGVSLRGEPEKTIDLREIVQYPEMIESDAPPGAGG